ncbi:MAG TPA: class I tRNA ligase family protein [Tepidisphaeraceae bacterium]|nr:class I tRNA ligase family protein [Tepidisphaeraceae bacterium]
MAINPTILDGKGERMSKSKGNGVDPVDIIHSHGADALRFTLTNMATETQDARMPVQVVCPHCAERLPNPDGKEPEMICGKCKKKLTRPVNNAAGSPDAPLARMTSEKFDLGRNFCNKLWNACRFALSNLEGTASAPPAGGAGASRPDADRDGPALAATAIPIHSGASGANADLSLDPMMLTLADQWIIARFHRAVEESNQALKNYRFDVYAKACYDFFWRDFCDWYVEAIKPAMKDPARAPQTGEVLAAVLDGALRLMHPMIPFITETIWWRLNDIRPARGLPGLLECPPSKRLVLAQWPMTGSANAFKTPGLRYSEDPDSGATNPYPRATDPGLRSTSDPASSDKVDHASLGSNNAETIFSRLQELIVAIRTIRNDYQVNPRQLVKASIKTPADFAAHIERNREMVELLATCAIQAVGESIPPVANAVTASAGGAEIFVEGLIDPNAEKARLEKDRDAKKKLIDSMKGRLSNEAYIAKAPAKLVQQTKDQLATAEAELAKIEEALKKLG